MILRLPELSQSVLVQLKSWINWIPRKHSVESFSLSPWLPHLSFCSTTSRSRDWHSLHQQSWRRFTHSTALFLNSYILFHLISSAPSLPFSFRSSAGNLIVVPSSSLSALP